MTAIVQTQGLSKRYGDRTALDRLDLAVAAGEIHALLGPNGAGKSTCLRLLSGLSRPTTGTVRLDGGDPRLPGTRRVLGALVEAPAFWSRLSGRENLDLLAAIDGRAGPVERERALEQVDLHRDGDRPYGTYSHGMRQRLGLAAALLGDPRVILLDEPCDGLDPVGVRTVERILLARAQAGAAVVLASHLLPEVAKIATHVTLLLDGRTAASGPIEALAAQVEVPCCFSVDRPEEAAALLAATGDTTASVDAAGRLLVRPGPVGPAETNARLVAHGFRVSALAPAEPPLEVYYRRIVEEGP